MAGDVHAKWVGSSAALSEKYGKLEEEWWNTPVSETFKLTLALALKINIKHYEEHLAKIRQYAGILEKKVEDT